MKLKKLGNKSLYLEKLSLNGFNVPQFIILNASESSSIWEKELKLFLKKDKNYAVRSSALNEDGLTSSKAGFYYSAIAVTPNNVIKEAKMVAKKQDNLGGIIVQEFVNTDKAGVMFSSNDKHHCIVEANFGLCSTVVGGENCDTYLISDYGDLIYSNIVGNKSSLFLNNQKMVKKNTSQQVLTIKELKYLHKIGKKIEKLFKYPQDIEWGFKNNKLFIFQSRIITVKPELKTPSVYDNANIAESYSGIVMPITISFIQDMYYQIYRNLMNASGVKMKIINKYDYYFKDLIAEYKGRVYYRMDNWFNMSALLPGFKRNQKNLKIMINSKHQDFYKAEVRPNRFLNITYPFIALFKIIILPFKLKYFQYKTKKELNYYYNLNWDKMNTGELMNNFILIKKSFIKPWHITIENDFLLMSWLGYLQKRKNKKNFIKNLSFISGNSEQLIQLKKISKIIANNPDFEKSLNSLKIDKFLKKIENNPHLKKEIDNFLKKYYNRMANELKLEVPTLKANYKDFLELLILYKDVNLNYFKIKTQKKLNLAYLFLFWHARKREECRLLRSQVFGLIKTIFYNLGIIYSKKNLINKKEDIYYLRVNEVFNFKNDFKKIISQRKNNYSKFEKLILPNYFVDSPENFKGIINKNFKSDFYKGVSASSGKVKGKVRICEKFSLPKKIDFEILVAKHTDPGWNPLLGLIKGLIVEQGGLLSHAAITARELGIPAVISVNNATRNLHNGQLVEIDGNLGTIKIIN